MLARSVLEKPFAEDQWGLNDLSVPGWLRARAVHQARALPNLGQPAGKKLDRIAGWFYSLKTLVAHWRRPGVAVLAVAMVGLF